MLMLTKEDLATIEHIVYNKARDIDVSIFNAILDSSYNVYALDSIMLYITKEGGIGNGLHIDNYNPNASVYQTYEALKILSALGFTKEEKNELFLQLIQKIGNYLFNRCPIEQGLWNPLVPSNDAYAHSEIFSYTEHPFPIFGLHPTPAILGYIVELTQENKAYYKKAIKQLQLVFKQIEVCTSWNLFMFESCNALIGSLKKTGLFPEECHKLEEQLKEEAIAHLDDENFNFPLYLSNIEVDGFLKEKIEEQLDTLITSRATHGLWEHKQGWGSNRYPEADTAALKWIGAESVWNIFLLKHYGRLEE